MLKLLPKALTMVVMLAKVIIMRKAQTRGLLAMASILVTLSRKKLQHEMYMLLLLELLQNKLQKSMPTMAIRTPTKSK